MIYKLRRALLAAWWAVHHADQLTMLRHDLTMDIKTSDSRGYPTISACKARLYLSYLSDLPIR